MEISKILRNINLYPSYNLYTIFSSFFINIFYSPFVVYLEDKTGTVTLQKKTRIILPLTDQLKGTGVINITF